MTNPKIRLIIPGKPPFELPNPADLVKLKTDLKDDLGLQDPQDYIDLYDSTDNKIDNQKIVALFEKRGGTEGAPRRAFPQLANPDGLIDYIQRGLRIRRDVLREQFKAIPEHSDAAGTNQPNQTAIIDGQRPPPGAVAATVATDTLLKDNTNAIGTLSENATLTPTWL
ncbi:MAG: hypothetical protein ABI651_13505 [Verrucomicrobiota bacterium]